MIQLDCCDDAFRYFNVIILVEFTVSAAETLLLLLFGDTLPFSSFYNSSWPLESSSRFKLMM
jgi:hypothetical protein